MPCLNLVFVALLQFFLLCQAENNDPVVFVHGYGGSSEHFQYQEELSSSGLRSFAADVNPYASNHIRACELYAQIKGVLTDYGVCYSKENKIERFGQDYTGKGFYPEWSETKQLHLIGHSQGGLTVRYLERMMEQGSDCKEDTFEFFTGGKRWITSLTAMATPQEGSSIFDPDFGPFPEYFIPKTFMKLTMTRENFRFPFMGLVPDVHEPLNNFFDRVESSGMFDSKLLGIYDMSTEGVAKFNENDPSPYEDRYYFGIATERTDPKEECYWYFLVFVCDEIQVPDPKMNDYYYETAEYIGKYAPPEDRENDGIVSNSRARCPRQNECVEVRDGSTQWEIGQWQYIDLNFVDHMQLVLRDDANDNANFENSAKRIWLEHGLRLKLIPSKSTSRDSSFEFETSEQAAKVERYLKAMRELSSVEDATSKKGTSRAGVALIILSLVALVAFGGLFLYRRNRRNKSEIDKNTASQAVPHFI